jgi:hypothetical protein
MRALLLLCICLLFTGCMRKTDLDALPHVTRVAILQHQLQRGDLFPPYLDAEKIPPLVTFIDSQRLDWTRAYAVGFGPPSPVYYAHLFEGDRYVGYFAVGAAVLPGSSALFEVRYGKTYARKRVTRSDANQFLDLIGRGGGLATTERPNQAVQRTAGRSPFQLRVPTNFNEQPRAPSPAVADLVSR